MADVILENLTKIYSGRITGVRDLNLHLKDGELLVLVGPSGCGKTTTLRLIAGLEQPSGGLIRINGRSVERESPRDRNVAMVFQDHSLYPHMTVQQNLAFGLKMRGVPRSQRDEKVRTAAEALGIAELLHRRPDSLSGGQRQRVALGRALVLRPQCFLLDEPLSNLDPAMRTQLRAQIRLLHRQINATIIYATHDQEDAMTLADRIAVMDQGEIVQIGTPMDLYHRPMNRFVAGFIGWPSMNFVAGRIQRDGAGLVFTDGYTLRLPVPDSRVLFLQPYLGQHVIAGLRPRQFVDAADGHDHHVPVMARVAMVEAMGDQSLLHLETTAGAPMLAIVNGLRRYEVDRHATLCIDPDAVHYFAPDEDGRHLFYACADTALVR